MGSIYIYTSELCYVIRSVDKSIYIILWISALWREEEEIGNSLFPLANEDAMLFVKRMSIGGENRRLVFAD